MVDVGLKPGGAWYEESSPSTGTYRYGVELRIRVGMRDNSPSGPAPDDPFVLAQQLISGHDGAAPYRENGRERTVGWQRFPRGQLTFIDQLPQPGREKHVQWPAAR